MAWIISWTPYAVVAMLGVSGKQDFISPLTSMIPALFAKTASIVDPIIYGLSHPKFQKELKKLFFGSRNRRRREDVTLYATRGLRVRETPSPIVAVDTGDERVRRTAQNKSSRYSVT